MVLCKLMQDLLVVAPFKANLYMLLLGNLGKVPKYQEGLNV